LKVAGRQHGRWLQNDGINLLAILFKLFLLKDPSPQGPEGRENKMY